MSRSIVWLRTTRSLGTICALWIRELIGCIEQPCISASHLACSNQAVGCFCPSAWLRPLPECRPQLIGRNARCRPGILPCHAIQRYRAGLRDLTVMKWRGLPRRKAAPHQGSCEAERVHHLGGKRMKAAIHIKARSLILGSMAAPTGTTPSCVPPCARLNPWRGCAPLQDASVSIDGPVPIWIFNE